MSVKIAKNSGFCFGVKRAINISFEVAKTSKEVVTLGPIIHNPQMVKKLSEKGIVKVEDISEIQNRPAIIRSHGIKKTDYENLRNENIEIINATCPYVSKTQEHAMKLSQAGYQVVILGDKQHPEVEALCSYVDGEVIVVSSEKELPKILSDKVGVISQTTRKLADFQELTNSLSARCSDLKVINTICNATSVRQQSTKELAQECDIMIVIGGKNSSNTKMLAKISEKFIQTYHVETMSEIDKKWFNGKEKIGLTAGASTPDWIIVEVYNKILKCLGNDDLFVTQVDNIPGFKEEK
jgi:4-hydroxy-3-methylbut-2-en-1-yl diphosphate reductase